MLDQRGTPCLPCRGIPQGIQLQGDAADSKFPEKLVGEGE
jgi:hypothetical protein